MRPGHRLVVKRVTSQARSLDRGLRDTLLPLCAAAIVVAIAVLSAVAPSTSAPRHDRFHEDPRDASLSFLVWQAAASSTESLP